MVRPPAVIHINITDFAARVEACRTPCLGNMPLVIAPDRAPRARVFDMNEAAFQEGVRKGMPLATVLRRHPGIPVRPPRFKTYGQVMKALFRQAAAFSPRVNAGPADGHLYLDITGTSRLYGPPPDVAWRLKQGILKHLGLDPIWTLATNRLVAKAASRLVKPTGEYIVGPGEEAAFLSPLPITLMPGLTKAERRTLLRFNISVVSQARALTRSQLAVPFDARAGIIHDLLQGIDARYVDIRPGPDTCPGIHGKGPVRTKIRAEHRFADDTNDTGHLKAGLALMTAEICGKLRQSNCQAAQLTLILTHSDTLTRTRRMNTATADDSRMLKQAWDLTLAAWTRRVRIQHLALCCTPRPAVPAQACLFERPSKSGSGQLHQAMDKIRTRFGTLAVQSGTTLALGPLTAQATRAQGPVSCA